MTLEIQMSNVLAPKFKGAMDGLAERFDAAIKTAADNAAALIQQRAINDLKSNGLGKFASGLQVKVEGSALGNMRIAMTSDDPRVGLFETGGKIHGNPLMWIPLSGTDAVGVLAKNFPGGLYSATPPGRRPLLFAVSDRKPRYFGIEEVQVKQRLHLREIQRDVMRDFQQLFNAAFKGS